MKKESKYCIACKKVESRDECSFGPEVWDLCSVKSKVVSEASKREKIANAFLGATFTLGAAQSPEHFVTLGKDAAPNAVLMQMWAEKRGKAGVDYLDNGRVSHPSRNRKRKLKEGKIPSKFSKNLPSNKKRNKYYQSNLKASRVPLGEEIDKKMLMMMIVKKLMDEKKRRNYLLNYGYIGEAKTPAWSRSEGKDLVKGGLNRKGIASYRRENPGSKLSMAVTTDPSKLKKGSKSWKRRKSFCSRSAGQMRMWPKAAKDPNSRLRLARRKWNC